MPLLTGASSQAFDANVRNELEAGKPLKQSLAIAYAVRQKNQKAKGGLVTPSTVTPTMKLDASKIVQKIMERTNGAKETLPEESLEEPIEEDVSFEEPTSEEAPEDSRALMRKILARVRAS